MTVSDPSILRVVASFLWTDGNVNQNVYNCAISGAGAPWDEADVVADCEDWLDNMYLNIAAGMSDAFDGNEIVVYKYDVVGDDWDEVGSEAWLFNPTATSPQLPRGVAALVRLWTADPDVQGKKYLPALTEGVLDDGLWMSALITDLLAFGADWYAPFVGTLTGATFTPGVWSVVQKTLFLGINHIATSTIPAYQRRRKRNVGI